MFRAGFINTVSEFGVGSGFFIHVGSAGPGTREVLGFRGLGV